MHVKWWKAVSVCFLIPAIAGCGIAQRALETAGVVGSEARSDAASSSASVTPIEPNLVSVWSDLVSSDQERKELLSANCVTFRVNLDQWTTSGESSIKQLEKISRASVVKQVIAVADRKVKRVEPLKFEIRNFAIEALSETVKQWQGKEINNEPVRNSFLADLAAECEVAKDWESLNALIAQAESLHSRILNQTSTYMSSSYKDSYTDSCLAKASPGSNTSRKGNLLYYSEDRYTNSGDLYVSFNLINLCGRPVRGFEYTLELTDAFGDVIFRGAAKFVASRAVKPGRSYAVNSRGQDGVFFLSGSRWHDLMQWWDSRQTRQTEATWETTITRVLYD